VNVPPSAPPWQPLTFGGVAAFARGSLFRLIQVQALSVALVAVCFVAFVASAWFPVIDQAMTQLPEEARIRHGQMQWPATEPITLGQTSFLAIAVNPRELQSPGYVADLELLLGPEGFRWSSLLGHWSLPYPRGWLFELSRKRAEAWWGAWRRPLMIAGFVGTWMFLMGFGWIAGLLGAFPVRAIARTLRRQADLAGCWRVAVAGLIPSGFWFAASLVLYGAQQLPLAGFLIFLPITVLLACLYLIGASLCLPRIPPHPRRTGNPFNPGAARGKSAGPGKNPFARR
jgi:hypothetical protein